MSFSKHIETYPPVWRNLLEAIGNDQAGEPMVIGPFETLGKAINIRNKFYAYCRLVAKWPHSTPAMIEGARRARVKNPTEDFRLIIEDTEQENRYYKDVLQRFGTSKPLTDANVRSDELSKVFEEAGLSIPEIAEPAFQPTTSTQDLDDSFAAIMARRQQQIEGQK